jgi:hypothetical protein
MMSAACRRLLLAKSVFKPLSLFALTWCLTQQGILLRPTSMLQRSGDLWRTVSRWTLRVVSDECDFVIKPSY